MKHPRIEGGVKLTGCIQPMLAELSKLPAFTDPKYLFEIKWDGYRAIAEITDKSINRLYSRNGTSYSKQFGKVFSELGKIKTNAILDGEIVVFDQNGKPSFQLIQNYSSKQNYTIQYMVFDILSLEGKDLRKLRLRSGKQFLRIFYLHRI